MMAGWIRCAPSFLITDGRDHVQVTIDKRSDEIRRRANIQNASPFLCTAWTLDCHIIVSLVPPPHFGRVSYCRRPDCKATAPCGRGNARRSPGPRGVTRVVVREGSRRLTVRA